MFRSIAVAAISVLFGTSASAATVLTCAELVGHNMPSIGSAVAVSLNAGDQVTVTAGSGGSAYSVEVGASVQQCGFIYPGGSSCANHVFPATVTGTYTFEKTGGPTADTLTCSPGRGIPTGGGGSKPIEGAAAQGSGAVLAAGASVGAVGGSINKALNKTPGSVTRDGLFFSSSGADGVYNGWASLQARNYSGVMDGESYEFTLGADMDLGAGRKVGLFLSVGRTDLVIGGTVVESDAVSFGPYVKMDFGERYSLTGYALFAQPDYTVGATSYRADRRALGVTVNAEYVIGNAEITSFIGLSGFQEDHPAAGVLVARDIESVTGSIGTRATFNPGSAFKPFVSLGFDFMRFDDGINGMIAHNTPRLGAGFSYDAPMGTLDVDVNGGEILQGTDDVEVRINYNLSF